MASSPKEVAAAAWGSMGSATEEASTCGRVWGFPDSAVPGVLFYEACAGTAVSSISGGPTILVIPERELGGGGSVRVFRFWHRCAYSYFRNGNIGGRVGKFRMWWGRVLSRFSGFGGGFDIESAGVPNWVWLGCSGFGVTRTL